MPVQIIVPLSGSSSRFFRAGYSIPKSLIQVEEKPIIAHVIELFGTNHDFLFVCNQEHLENPDWDLKKIILKHCPHAQVLGISPHKNGPVYAVLQALPFIRMNEPVVVNYCDFTCYWNFEDFIQTVSLSGCAGAIPAYKGFHPHSLGSTHYAYIKEQSGWISDIQEKKPFTDNRMEEFASSGTYYFSSGELMVNAFQQAMALDLSTKGEFYVSLAYKPLLERRKPIAVYPIQHFMQWGTPEDLEDYQYWSQAFKKLISVQRPQTRALGTVIMLMVGAGKRFVDKGYSVTKPLIPVSGKPMFLQATADLPIAKEYIFVLREDMPEYVSVCSKIIQEYEHEHAVKIKTLPSLTEGQACTALAGLEMLMNNEKTKDEPVTFGACDHGMLYDQKKFFQLLDNPTVDVIVWAVRGYPESIRHPEHYGWIESNGEKIINISVKKPLKSTKTDRIAVGTFTFKRPAMAKTAIQNLISTGEKVNGEFYLDASVNHAVAIGLNCVIFEIDSYLCWGTPDSLSTFEYWQSCFHKWNAHPYAIEKDFRIPLKERDSLQLKYGTWAPHFSTCSEETHA